jgi:hypothetical protein
MRPPFGRGSLCGTRGAGASYLRRRRREEADAILLDRWPNDLRVASDAAPVDPRFAAFVISVTGIEIAEIRDAFREVNFEPGAIVGKVDRHAVLDFQRHYGLTADGLIGKQTLSALQRELDARRKSKQGGAGAAGGAAVAGGNEAATPTPKVRTRHHRRTLDHRRRRHRHSNGPSLPRISRLALPRPRRGARPGLRAPARRLAALVLISNKDKF